MQSRGRGVSQQWYEAEQGQDRHFGRGMDTPLIIDADNTPSGPPARSFASKVWAVVTFFTIGAACAAISYAISDPHWIHTALSSSGGLNQRVEFGLFQVCNGVSYLNSRECQTINCNDVSAMSSDIGSACDTMTSVLRPLYLAGAAFMGLASITALVEFCVHSKPMGRVVMPIISCCFAGLGWLCVLVATPLGRPVLDSINRGYNNMGAFSDVDTQFNYCWFLGILSVVLAFSSCLMFVGQLVVVLKDRANQRQVPQQTYQI